jgi:hypothetical protein
MSGRKNLDELTAVELIAREAKSIKLKRCNNQIARVSSADCSLCG